MGGPDPRAVARHVRMHGGQLAAIAGRRVGTLSFLAITSVSYRFSGSRQHPRHTSARSTFNFQSARLRPTCHVGSPRKDIPIHRVYEARRVGGRTESKVVKLSMDVGQVGRRVCNVADGEAGKPLLLQSVIVKVAKPERSGSVCVFSQSTVNACMPVTRIELADAGTADSAPTMPTTPSTKEPHHLTRPFDRFQIVSVLRTHDDSSVSYLGVVTPPAESRRARRLSWMGPRAPVVNADRGEVVGRIPRVRERPGSAKPGKASSFVLPIVAHRQDRDC